MGPSHSVMLACRRLGSFPGSALNAQQNRHRMLQNVQNKVHGLHGDYNRWCPSIQCRSMYTKCNVRLEHHVCLCRLLKRRDLVKQGELVIVVSDIRPDDQSVVRSVQIRRVP